MSLPPNVQWVYDHHPEVGVKKKISQSIRKSNELEFRLMFQFTDLIQSLSYIQLIKSINKIK
jgi:hypothetical protein